MFLHEGHMWVSRSEDVFVGVEVCDVDDFHDERVRRRLQWLVVGVWFVIELHRGYSLCFR